MSTLGCKWSGRSCIGTIKDRKFATVKPSGQSLSTANNSLPDGQKQHSTATQKQAPYVSISSVSRLKKSRSSSDSTDQARSDEERQKERKEAELKVEKKIDKKIHKLEAQGLAPERAEEEAETQVEEKELHKAEKKGKHQPKEKLSLLTEKLSLAGISSSNPSMVGQGQAQLRKQQQEQQEKTKQVSQQEKERAQQERAQQQQGGEEQQQQQQQQEEEQQLQQQQQQQQEQELIQEQQAEHESVRQHKSELKEPQSYSPPRPLSSPPSQIQSQYRPQAHFRGSKPDDVGDDDTSTQQPPLGVHVVPARANTPKLGNYNYAPAPSSTAHHSSVASSNAVISAYSVQPPSASTDKKHSKVKGKAPHAVLVGVIVVGLVLFFAAVAFYLARSGTSRSSANIY